MKKHTYCTNHTVKLIAVFVAGITGATLGWYYSDRLNVAFGQGSDINMIANNWGDGGSSGFKKCSPTDKPREIRRQDGCDVVITTETCTPIQKYVHYERTRSGVRVSELSSPKRGAVAVTKYDTAVKEQRKELIKEIDDTSKEMNSYKSGKSASMLQSDERYQTWVKKYEELKGMEKSVWNKCRPTTMTEVTPNRTPVRQAK